MGSKTHKPQNLIILFLKLEKAILNYFYRQFILLKALKTKKL